MLVCLWGRACLYALETHCWLRILGYLSWRGFWGSETLMGEPPRISNMLLIPLLSLFTAEYSVPTIMKDCSKPGDGGAGKSCQLSCSAVGGYPQSTVRWTGLNQSLTNVIYNRSSADNESKTWTINQTIMHNCDQPANISCAVGGAVSHTITICETESFPSVVIAAITVVFVFLFLLLIFVVVMKYFFRGRQTSVTGYEAPGAGEFGDSSNSSVWKMVMKHSGDCRHSVKRKCFSTQSSTDGQIGQIVQFNTVFKVAWLLYRGRAWQMLWRSNAGLSWHIWTSFWERYLPFSRHSHMEEHIFSSASWRCSGQFTETFQVYVVGRRICKGAYEKIQSFYG